MVLIGNDGQDVIAGVYNGDSIPTRYGTLYAGAYHRWIAQGIANTLLYDDIPYYMINPEQSKVAEVVRRQRAASMDWVDSSILVNISSTSVHKSGIQIYANTREYSSIFGSFLSESLKEGLAKYKIPIYKVNYSCEHEFSLLSKVNSHGFHIVCGSTALNAELMINPMFQEDLIHSLSNGLRLCLTLDQD